MNKMKLSVAVCTYNGAQYVKEQLLSIINQDLPVDEIIVCDDKSTDNTCDLILKIKKESGANITIIENEENLGVSHNFQKAINRCSGDIIFLSDQDDVWYPNKVRILVEWFTNNPDKTVVFTDADLIDWKGNIKSSDTLFDRIGFSSKWQSYFDAGCELPIFCCNHATGATMAIKRKFIFADYCTNKILHDEIISLLALQTHSLGYIAKPLIKYRIHSNQEMSIPTRKSDSDKSFNKEFIYNPNTTIKLLQRWKFPLNDYFIRYIDVLYNRNTYINSPYGWIIAIKYLKVYKEFYKAKYLSFLCYDMKKSIKVLFRRIFIPK